ncbi:MAG: hypothetical protein UY41_C0046G0014 [Candidatus Moranbacteria bacterium GW2011_GWE1_49_15]|nr:MAG: hypothetical protein UX75_C0012G0012 [Candidatus Moranbacteria bacterium GW2011_GWE2_47_10]KKW05607.1 MAG: hypothetical protein UY41_C0046G0014 [Candidatus Moranbacteria bacterium GW2011_GWE1_49_15]HBP01309.1 hypothetical protein [Candidatus Moranbacteria bacterium]
MKNIFKSLFVIVAVAAVAGGATYAIFSDTSSFAGNTISTATVDIDARNEPSGLLPKPLNVSGIVPGEFTDWARGIVFNTANSTDIRLFMYVTNVTGAACNKTNLEVYTGNADPGNTDNERDFQLYNGVISGLAGVGNRVEITGPEAGKVYNPTMPTNHSAVIQQRAQLDPSAGNSYQNTSCTWDEIFVAETI